MAPLYGDVQIRFADWVRQLAHYDPSKWTCTSESQEEKATVAIQNRVEIIRSEHVRFISELARYNNEVILINNTRGRSLQFIKLFICIISLGGIWYYVLKM